MGTITKIDVYISVAFVSTKTPHSHVAFILMLLCTFGEK